MFTLEEIRHMVRQENAILALGLMAFTMRPHPEAPPPPQTVPLVGKAVAPALGGPALTGGEKLQLAGALRVEIQDTD